MKLKAIADTDGGLFLFWCPGCREPHPYWVKPQSPGAAAWAFNGDKERPTFTPSLLVYPSGTTPRCHLFLTDGVIHFCGDSQHELAGKSVPLPDWPERG